MVVSIARIIILVKLLANADPDVTYGSSSMFYWTSAEVNSAIVCACLMTLRPLAGRWLPRWFTSHPYSDEIDSNRRDIVTVGASPSRPPVLSLSSTAPNIATDGWINSSASSPVDDEKISPREDV